MAQIINEQFTIISNHHSKPILVDIRYEDRDEKMPVIIFCHGFKGFKDWGHFNHIANYFSSRGYIFVKFNFSHNGTTVKHPTEFVDLEAFGNNNVTTELDDLKDIIDAIYKKHPSLPPAPIKKKKIYLMGHSRGGGIAILKAAEDDRIAAVSAWAPVDNFKERYSGEIIKQWKREGVYIVHNSRTGQDMPLYYQMVEDIINNDERTSIPDALKKINIPVLALHGTNDETLDYKKTTRLQTFKKDLQVKLITDANHTFGGSHPWSSSDLPEHTLEALKLIDEFFRQNDYSE